MTTRSIVPRADGEGSIGTAAKKWGGLFAARITTRMNSTAYVLGDVAFSASLPSSLVLKCTTAGTTAASEPSMTGAAEGGTVTDGTVVWTYQKLISDSVPLGSILPYSANAQNPPYGFLYCEGQAVSRTMYPDLFALIGTTYGSGDGSTTFNLPNMLDRYPEGSTTAGTVKSAGLPDIEGLMNNVVNAGGGYSGAINSQSSVASTYSQGASGYRSNLSFVASRYNAIYGNSDTVTPPTLTVRWIIKAYDAPTPSSAQIDLSQYASDLAKRLTREQTPAFNKRDVVTVSGTYTAPVTGWYKITVKGGGGGGGASFDTSGGNQLQSGGGGGEGGTTIGYEKMTAGQTAAVVIGAGGTGGTARTVDTATNGGNSVVTVNSNTYTGGGGGKSGNCHGGAGGTGTTPGAPGNTGLFSTGTITLVPGTGGGNGGGSFLGGINGTEGGGGGGGLFSNASPYYYAGGKGGDGYAWFEYFDPSLM